LTPSCFCCSSSSSSFLLLLLVALHLLPDICHAPLSSHRFSHLCSCFLLLLSIFHLPLLFLLKRLSLSSILVPIRGRLLLLLHPLSVSHSLSLAVWLFLPCMLAIFFHTYPASFFFFFFFWRSFERMLFSNSGVSLLLLLKHLG
jgi:hypothetical protein